MPSIRPSSSTINLFGSMDFADIEENKKSTGLFSKLTTKMKIVITIVMAIVCLVAVGVVVWRGFQTPSLRTYVFNVTRIEIEVDKLVELHRLNIDSHAFQEYAVSRRYFRTLDIRYLNKHLWNKWLQLPASFENVMEVLRETNTNGTVIEEFFYLARPEISEITESGQISYKWKTNLNLENQKIGNCTMFEGCHKTEYTFRDGTLRVINKIAAGNETLEILRVYYIPSKDLFHMPSIRPSSSTINLFGSMDFAVIETDKKSTGLFSKLTTKMKIGITIMIAVVCLVAVGVVVWRGFQTPSLKPYVFNATRLEIEIDKLVEKHRLNIDSHAFQEYAVANHRFRTMQLKYLKKPLWNKWLPSPSSFENVTEVLKKTNTNGTVIEEFFYLARPEISEITSSVRKTNFKLIRQTNFKVIWKTNLKWKNQKIGNCTMLGGCHKAEYTIKNGTLRVINKIAAGNETLEMKRDYYISSKDLLKYQFA